MKKLFKLAFAVLLSAMLALGIISCGKTGDGVISLDKILGEYGITLEGGGFSDTAKLLVEEIDLKGAIATEVFNKLEEEGITLDNEAKTYIYDIFVKDGDVEVQPDGTVKVTIPAPEGSDEEYVVYHVKDSGDIEEIVSYLKDGKLVFETDGFSIFVISVKNKQTGKKLSVKNYVNYADGFTNFGFNHVYVNGFPIRDSENLNDEFVFNTGEEVVLSVDLPEGSATFLGWYEADADMMLDGRPTSQDPILNVEPLSTEHTFIMTMPEEDCNVYAVFMPREREFFVDGGGATVEINGEIPTQPLVVRVGDELKVKITDIPDRFEFANVEVLRMYGKATTIEEQEFTYTVGIYDKGLFAFIVEQAPDSISANVEVFSSQEFSVGTDYTRFFDNLRVVANYGDEEVVLKKDEYSFDFSKVNADEAGTYEIIIRHNQSDVEFSFNITFADAYSLEVRTLTLPESKEGEVLISEKSYTEWNEGAGKLIENFMVPFSASENEEEGIFFLGWFEYDPMVGYEDKPVEKLSRAELACVFGEESVTTRRSFTYEMPARDVVIYAVYGKPQSVNVNLHPESIGMGYITIDGVEGSHTNWYYNFEFLVHVNVTAHANDGYVFDGWYEIEPQNGSYFKVVEEETVNVHRSTPWNLYLKFVEVPMCEFEAYSTIEQSSESYEWNYNFSEVNGEPYGDDFYSSRIDFGETVTIKANPELFCEFIGWFEVSDMTDTNISIGDPISSDLEYTFTAEGEFLRVIAVYREIPATRVVIEANKCGTLIVNGEEYESYDEVLEVGTQITVTLTQEPQMTFIAWATYRNGEEIILSSELTYTFTVGREYMHISAKGEPVVA